MSEFELEDEEGEVREENIGFEVDDIVLKLKYGDEEELKVAVLRMSELIEEKRIGSDWIANEGVIPALFGRLSSGNSEYMLIMIHLLTTLALDNPLNKEKMGEIRFLSVLVRSLTREADERREAVGLLLKLSELSCVRRRIGRIQGCIVMLVVLLNGDDPIASRDAENLLNRLSTNTQNALHMAEAGYFKPIVQYLKEGSDMSKILMATALSRMELTDQNRSSLREDGAIKPLVKLFAIGKLEAKASALNAILNLSGPPENAHCLARSGIFPRLLNLLFCVTSSFTALREPASAVLAQIVISGPGHGGPGPPVWAKPEIAQQILSLLSLSGLAVRGNLLRALNGLASWSRVRRRMLESSAVRLVSHFLAETNYEVRSAAVALLFTLCSDTSRDSSEQIEETDIAALVGIIASSESDTERADSLGILSQVAKIAEIFRRENLLSVVVSAVEKAKSEVVRIEEGAAGVLVRITTPPDNKTRNYVAAENGVVPLLLRLLSSDSALAKTRAATSLGHLSMSSFLEGNPAPGWLCGVQTNPTKGSFCLVKSGAVPLLLRILEGSERGADEAVLGALATLLRDETWESGSDYVAKTPCFFEAVLMALGPGTAIGAREKALWIVERVFKVEEYRIKYGESAQAVLIDLAQNGDLSLKPMIAKLLAQLELLQLQSSYF